MKKKIAIFALLFGFVAAQTVLVSSASAQEADQLTEVQLQLVSQRCQQMQPQLRDIQQRDTVLRINRGRLYDLTLRQTGAFVSRLQTHDITSPDVEGADTKLRALFIDFKEQYNSYAALIDRLIGMDCTERPRDFYGTLMQAQRERAIIGQTVKSMDQTVNTYIAGLRNLQQNEQIRGQQ